MKLNHVVWWFTVDSFDGKEQRHYRDFTDEIAAKQWMDRQPGTSATHPLLHHGAIKDQPWHHSHATVKPTPTAAHYKMTKLEAFVWNNPHVDFAVLASQTNRTVSSIERAYDRAKKKDAAKKV